MEIILIRHGESVNNALYLQNCKIFTGQSDVPLTSKGIMQAKNLKGHLLLEHVDAYYASDLSRALETARCITDEKIIIDSRLRERTLGDFDGKLESDMISDPLYSCYFTDPKYKNFRNDFHTRAPNGENYNDVIGRVTSFLEDLKKTNYRKVVICTHFCTIRCFIKILNHLSEEETLKLKIYNCEPIVLHF